MSDEIPFRVRAATERADPASREAPSRDRDTWARQGDVYSLLERTDGTGVAEIYIEDPDCIEGTFKNVSGPKLAVIVRDLRGHSDLRLKLAEKVLEYRHFAEAAPLEALRAALTDTEQCELVATVGPSARSKLLAVGFSGPVRGQEGPSSTAADRVRLTGADTSRFATFLCNTGFETRIDAFAAGVPAFTSDERGIVASWLRDLDQESREALRKALERRAPTAIARDAAFDGLASVSKLMTLLSAELLGHDLEVSTEILERARDIVRRHAQYLPQGEDSDPWVSVLSRSEAAIELVDRMMLGTGFEFLRHFSLADLDGLDLGLGRPSFEGQNCRIKTYYRAISVDHAAIAASRSLYDRVGPRSFELGLDALANAQDPPFAISRHIDALRFHVYGAVHDLGFEGAVQLALAIEKNPFGAHCAQWEDEDAPPAGAEPLYRLAQGKSADEIDRALARAERRVADFTSSGRPLWIWQGWPKEVSTLETGPGSGLGVLEASKAARAMKEDLKRVCPEQLELLERELMGRQFVSRLRYNQLYEKGAREPELAYFPETLASWKDAKAFLAEAAITTRGRALEPGELTSLIRETHRRAAEGMVLREYLPAAAVGVFRYEIDRSELPRRFTGNSFERVSGAVFTGGGALSISAADLDRLRQNSIIKVHLVDREDNKLELAGIEFADLERIDELVRELDAFVREHEGKIPSESLAAEVHHRLISIHPFLDGNGRVAKLIANFLLARADIEPAVWQRGSPLLEHDTWAEAVAEGVRFCAAIVEKHWRAAGGAASSLRDHS